MGLITLTIISYHGRPARWISLFWQPVCPLHLYTRIFFLMANKLLLLLVVVGLHAGQLILFNGMHTIWIVDSQRLFLWASQCVDTPLLSSPHPTRGM